MQFVTVFFSHKKDERSGAWPGARAGRSRWRSTRTGARGNLYGVGGCPTTVFARDGGGVRATKLGNLTEAELRRATGAAAG